MAIGIDEEAGIQSNAPPDPDPQPNPLAPQTQQNSAYSGIPEYNAPSRNVADNLNTLLQKDSPYLKQAESYARSAANSRGLINSSMAVNAAEEARINAALPIASQDAAQAHQLAAQQAGYDWQSGENVLQRQHELATQSREHTFQFALSDQQALQALDFMNSEYAAKGALSSQEAQQALDFLNQEWANRGTFSSQEAQQALALLDAEYGFKSELLTQEGAQQLDLMEAQYGFTSDLQRQAFQEDLVKMEEQFGYTSLLSAQEATQRLQEMAADYNNRTRLLAADYAQQGRLSAQEAQQAMDYLDAEYLNRGLLSEQEFTQTLERDNNLTDQQKELALYQWQTIERPRMVEESRLRTQLMNQENQLAMARDAALANQEYLLQELRGEQSLYQAETLAAIEAEYRTLMQSSASAAEFMLNVNNQISEILRSSLSGDAKNTAVGRMIDMLESGLTVIGEVGGIDLAALLDYGDIGSP